MQEHNSEELRASSLSPVKRYEFFVTKSVELGGAWGLYDNGWVTTEDDDGSCYFPLWQRKTLAMSSALEGWKEAEPEFISIEALADELLPALEEDGYSVGVFYVEEHGSVGVDPQKLKCDLGYILENRRPAWERNT